MPSPRAFSIVRAVGLTLPGVEVATRYDGSRVLRLHGCFMAGLATHPSAEPRTLVVRAALDARPLLLADAPETYYLTDYYERYPLVLVRLSAIDRTSLRDVLQMSWRLTNAKLLTWRHGKAGQGLPQLRRRADRLRARVL